MFKKGRCQMKYKKKIMMMKIQKLKNTENQVSVIVQLIIITTVTLLITKNLILIKNLKKKTKKKKVIQTLKIMKIPFKILQILP